MRKKRRRRPEPYRNGDVTLGRREDGFAVADFRDESTGKRKRVRLSVKFAETKAAQAALDKFAEARRAIAKQQASCTVGDLWDLWLKERAADKLDNKIYAANWVSLRPFFASRSPMLLKAQDYRDYAKARFNLGRSSWTVNTELVRLRACLKWAAETRLIPERPKVWVPTPGKNRDRVLTVAEARSLVEAARKGDPHIYLFVVLLFATGARHTATLDLTWDRIDFVAGIIDFDEDLPPDPMSKAWRKGRATVAMNKTARAALREAYEGRQTDHVIEHGGRRLKNCGDGFYFAVRRAGLGEWVDHPTKTDPETGRPVRVFETDITPHVVRHTVSTWLEAKVDDRRRAQLLGHADVQTTNKIYTHSDAALTAEAVALLDAEFAPLPKISHSEVKSGAEDAEFEDITSQWDRPKAKKVPRGKGRKKS